MVSFSRNQKGVGMDRLEELRKRFKREPCFKKCGAKLEKLRKGYAVVRVKISESMVVLEGFANGGYLGVIGNSAGVYAAMSKLPAGHTRALSIFTYFHSTAKKSQIVRGVARVTEESRSYIWVAFRVVGLDGKLKASGVIQYTKPKE